MALLKDDGYFNYLDKNGAVPAMSARFSAKRNYIVEKEVVKAEKLRDSLNAYLTLPQPEFGVKVNAQDFCSIIKTLRVGIYEGKSDKAIAQELGTVLLDAFESRSIVFK